MTFQMTKTLTFALPKGRLLEEIVAFLKKCGMNASFLLKPGRKLVFPSSNGQPGFILVRSSDVASYVYQGAADLGIVGNDILREQELAVYEPLDLELGRCRLVLAGMPEQKERFEKGSLGVAHDFSGIRIATKYPNLCQKWAQEEGLDVEVLPLHGALEIAPLTDFSDYILDLVSTGKTLEQNGLVEIKTVLKVSARLIVNRAALKTCAGIESLIQTFRKVI